MDCKATRKGIICIKTVCTNSSTMFTVVLPVSSVIVVSPTLEAKSQRGGSSMVWWKLNLYVWIVWHRFSRRILVLDNLVHNDTRIGVWRHRGERTLLAYNRHRHTGPSPLTMIWRTTGRTFRSPFVYIYGKLSNRCYIYVVLRPVVLPLFEPCETLCFRRIMDDRM